MDAWESQTELSIVVDEFTDYSYLVASTDEVSSSLSIQGLPWYGRENSYKHTGDRREKDASHPHKRLSRLDTRCDEEEVREVRPPTCRSLCCRIFGCCPTSDLHVVSP